MAGIKKKTKKNKKVLKLNKNIAQPDSCVFDSLKDLVKIIPSPKPVTDKVKRVTKSIK